MRKRVLILAAAVLLALVLAIPASASKPTDVRFTSTWDYIEHNCQERQVGDRCFVTFDLMGTYDGGIKGNWTGTYSTLAKGPCETEYPGCGPGPFAYPEAAKLSVVVTEAKVLTSSGEFTRSGEFTMSCQAKVRQEPLHLEDYECVIQSGTSGLAGLHGIAKYSSANAEWWGQVHFDGK